MSTPSRRRLAKGIAWTAPAITIAATAPALAASGSEAPVLVTGSSWADKCQGESQISGGWSKQGYRIRLTVSPADAPAPQLLSAVAHNGDTARIIAGPVAAEPGVWEYLVDTGSNTSSVNLTYSFDGGETLHAKIPTHPHCGGM